MHMPYQKKTHTERIETQKLQQENCLAECLVLRLVGSGLAECEIGKSMFFKVRQCLG